MDDLEVLILRAQSLEEQGCIQEALDLYLQVLQKEEHKERWGEISFHIARLLFAHSRYDEAMHMFIQAFGLGYNRDEILNILDEAYYNPNVDQFKQTYYKNIEELLSVYPHLNVCNFADLPLKFFPVSEEKFYIFDQRSGQFCGTFQNNPQIANENIVVSEKMVVGNEYNAKNIAHYASLLKMNGVLYVVYDPMMIFLSYLQISDFSEIINSPHVELFFSLDEISAYCKNNEGLRPTGSISVHEEDKYGLEYFIKEEICTSDTSGEIPAKNKEQQDVTDSQGRNRFLPDGDPDILLSICIPTFNRGRRALANVRHTLQLAKDLPVEVVVSDNASPDDDNKYKEISNISDTRLIYHRNNENIGFGRNILRAIELARGKYVCLFSDEDFINLDIVPHFLELLRNSSELSIVRGSIQPVNATMQRANSINYPDALLRRGKEALIKYAFEFTYLSGSAYNREVLRYKACEKIWEGVDKHVAYPHMFIEAFLCTQGNVRLYSGALCLEGESELPLGDPTVFGRGMALSFEARLEQHRLFSEAASELMELCQGEEEFKACMYLKICERTFRFITEVNGPFYFLNGRDLPTLIERVERHCLHSLADICKDKSLYRKLEILIKDAFFRHHAKMIEIYPSFKYADKIAEEAKFNEGFRDKKVVF